MGWLGFGKIRQKRVVRDAKKPGPKLAPAMRAQRNQICCAETFSPARVMRRSRFNQKKLGPILNPSSRCGIPARRAWRT